MSWRQFSGVKQRCGRLSRGTRDRDRWGKRTGREGRLGTLAARSVAELPYFTRTEIVGELELRKPELEAKPGAGADALNL